MLIEKVFLSFNNYKPVIKYGDIIYHFIANILAVATQLAASIAAAIIFYYCIEFVNKKKDMERYINIRRTLLFSIYNHMEIFSQMSGFESIRLGNLNKRFYDIESIEKSKNYEGYLRRYNSEVDSLKKCKDYGYIKNSRENIDLIIDAFEELESVFEFYKNPIEGVDINYILEEVAKKYIYFTQLTLYFEININEFIRSVEKYKIINFIRMLD